MKDDFHHNFFFISKAKIYPSLASKYSPKFSLVNDKLDNIVAYYGWFSPKYSLVISKAWIYPSLAP